MAGLAKLPLESPDPLDVLVALHQESGDAVDG
jgi:hypothetical protein